MTDPVAEAARPPADLDARYRPFAQWHQLPVDLHLLDEAAAELDRECRDADPAAVRAAELQQLHNLRGPGCGRDQERLAE